MNRKGIARLTRKEAFSHYKILFVIVTEGKTEENYFTMLKTLKKENIEIVCKKGRHSSVNHLINTINKEIDDRGLNEHSECWIILDNDVLSTTEINKLREWINSTNTETMKSVGLSSPKFEYWLLLHYEVPRAYVSKADCLLYLKKWIPEYKKPFKNCTIIANRVSEACENAKKRDITLGSANNGTNLHHLVTRLYQ
jgi:hypothetical protein